jgi:membrane protein YdbS with pleckstrin-like domain
MSATATVPVVTQKSGKTTSWAPTAKVSAGVLASAVTVLIVQFVPHANTWTPAVAAAITQIVTFAVQYMVPEQRYESTKRA